VQITRIRVSGFKSFSDPVELAIEGGLTGIVGPNGCGKSNIVEALRWAMGESSAKGLRGDEMEDVIFNGTGSRPAHDVAEVRLKLHGRPPSLSGPANGEDLEISRKLARGVGSTFRIAGREARARDIQLLFADAGAGARSPAIVGQGQIGFIVDAKPAERRKLLEDAAGIGGLQTRRREAELKLEATQANLQRVLDLLGTQEERLAELKKQTRQAERYRRLAAELRRAEALLLLARHAAAAAAATRADEAAAEARAELEQRATAAAGARRTRDQAQAALPAQRERAVEESARAAGLRERLAGLRAAAESEAAHLTALERQHAEAVADLGRGERTVQELTAAVASTDAELRTLSEARAALDAAVAAAAQAEQVAAAALEAAQANMHQAVAAAAEGQAQLEAAQARSSALEGRAHAIAAERKGLPDLAAVRGARDRAEADLVARTGALEEARTSLAAVEADLQRLEPARVAQQAEHLAAERALAAAREELVDAELRLREAETAAARLAERRELLARQDERLAERRRSHAARAETLARGLAEADAAARGQELALAEAELRAADGVLDAAREAASAAEHARSEAAERLRELRRAADAVAAEIRVLESLDQEAATGGLLDCLSVPEELGPAVAAALGDDLLAGTDPEAPCSWRELPPAEGSDAAALPEPVPSLRELVGAPPVLHPRLAQVGLVEAGEAAALQPRLRTGQRLVSRDGGLWRWDGFVRAPGAEDVGVARVRHRLRLHTAREEAAAFAGRIVEGQTAVDDGEATLRTTRASLAEAEARWRAADSAQLRAQQRLAEAEKHSLRLVAEAQLLATEEAGLAHEVGELAGERETLDRLAQGFEDVAALRATVEAKAAERAAAEATLRRQLAVARELQAEHGRTAVASRDRRAACERFQVEMDRARAAAERAAREAVELEAAHRTRAAAIQAEEEGVRAALEAAQREAEDARAAADRRRRDQAAAEAALGATAQEARTAAERLAGLRAETAALGERSATLTASRDELQARLAETERACVELQRRAQRLAGELAAAGRDRRSDPAELERLAAEADAAEAAARAGRAEQEEREATLARLERELEAAERGAGACRERLAVAQAERSHARAALAAAVALIEERLQQAPETLLADEETRAAVQTATIDALEEQVARLRASRERIGPVNLRAEVEVAELEAALGESRAREAELWAAVERLRAGIATLNREGRERLMAAFAAVDGHFRRLFQTLFGGGKAHLRLSGADDPLQAGLELEASPPGKKLASISLLSGGEKTLTALALVFGFFLAQPSPLCVLDEVDAPLDDANVDRFVELMQEIARATGTRFLVVTHHPLTMARMDRLYGVTMAERGISRLVSVALEEALELRATA
jgi:chromosome segregation protein